MRLWAQPQHAESAPEAQKDFRESVADTLARSLPASAEGKPVEVWFEDDARAGQQGTLTRIWAKKGSRPLALCDRRYDRAYIFGAACPVHGTCAALVLPQAVVMLEGMGWHGAGELKLPLTRTLIRLLPYSPELNSVENIWE